MLLVRAAELRTKKDGGTFLKLTLGDRTGALDGQRLGRRRGASRALRRAAGRSTCAASTRSTRSGARRSSCARFSPAEPGTFDEADLLDGPPRGAARDGGRPARAGRDGPGPAPARAARRASSARARATWAAYRDAPGGQALPPGLRARPARALARRRAGGQRDQRDVPRASTATSRSPARCCTTSASSRRTPPDGGAIDLTDAGQAAGRDPARLLPHPPRDRGARRASRPRPAQAVLHIILSHHGSLEHGSPVVPAHARGDARAHDRQPRRAPGQLRPAREGAGARAPLVGLRPRASAAARSSGRVRRAGRAERRRARSGLNSRKDRAEAARGARTLASPRLPLSADGEGHREADPAALADLVPDGRAPARHGARDPARRRGLQRDERGRVRAALLRRPRGARVAGHPADGRQARRRRRRAGELLAAPGELPPPRDRVHRRGARRRCRSRCSLLDGEFAYAEPLRLALQQITWGRPEPAAGARPALGRARHHRARPAATSSRSAWRRSRRRSSASKTITFDYYTMERDETGARKVDPYHLLFRAGSSTCSATRTSARRSACSASRASAARSPTRRRPSTTSSAPTDFDPRAYANRADWQFGDEQGVAEIADLRAHRLAGRAPLRPLRRDPRRRDGRRTSSSRRRTRTRASSSRGCSGLGEHAHVAGPAELVAEAEERIALIERAPRRRARARRRRRRRAARADAGRARGRRARGRREAAIRPERFARLVTLASILIEAGRAGRARCASPRSASALQITEAELREDINVLNVVNFGGGSYVLYAEIHDDGDDRGRPRALLATTSTAPRACCPSRPRRWSRRST